MKKYIVYRNYNTGILGWRHERTELTKEELLKYIENHLPELGDIEVFKRDEKVKIQVSVNME